MQNRIEIIDSLRGIAVLMVTWFHMTNTYSDGFVKSSGQYGWLGLEIFFVISGFIIPYAMYRSGYKIKKDYGRFLLKRFTRIEPPYIIAMLCTLALLYLSSLSPGFQGTPPDISAKHVFLHFGYLNGIFGYSWFNPVFWTLAIEFQFYLFISLLFPLMISKNSVLRDMSFFLISLLPLTQSQEVFIFHYMCLFAFGILTFQALSKIISIKKYFFMFIVVSVFSYFSLGLLITVVAVFTSLFILFVKIKEFRILTFLGSISYSLYLLHIPIGGRVVNIGKRFADSDIEFVFISILATLISIICAYYFYKFIEKPAMNLASRIKY